MKNIKKTLILLIILVLIISAIMIAIAMKQSKGETRKGIAIVNTNRQDENHEISEDDADVGDVPLEIIVAKEAQILKDKPRFFSVEKMINTYLEYVNAGNSIAIYSILDNSYINNNGISVQNVLDVIQQTTYYIGKYQAKEMYIKDDTYKPIYYIYGTLEENLKKSPVYFTMYQDNDNMTFALKPISQEEYLLCTSGSKKETYKEEIKLTDYNRYTLNVLNNEQIAQRYFENYINDARYYPQDAYNSLDERYKNLRFGSYENFTAYLTQKAAELEALDYKAVKNANQFQSQEEYQNYIKNLDRKRMEKYYIYTVDETEYCICVDGYGNYYIFKIIDVMNYKLILDTYTIDLPDFLEKYKDASIEDKVILNIEKIFEALNNKDYNYVYNKLEPTYRENTVGTYENFATIMSKNLYEKNSIEYETFTKGENFHKYTLTITDATGKNQAKIQMNITMMLGENTDYTIKFE